MSTTPVPPTPSPGGRWWILLLQAALVMGLLALFWRYWDHEAFIRWKSATGPVPFFLALAILPALGFPTTPFYLLAGASFDLPTAIIGSLLALAVNLTLTYHLAQGPLRSWLEKRLARIGRQLPHPEARHHCHFAVLVKLLPGLPVFLKNAVIALAGVPFPIYFGVSFGISGIYAVAFVVLGESAFDQDYSQAIIVLLVLAAISAGLYFLHRRRRGAGKSR